MNLITLIAAACRGFYGCSVALWVMQFFVWTSTHKHDLVGIKSIFKKLLWLLYKRLISLDDGVANINSFFKLLVCYCLDWKTLFPRMLQGTTRYPRPPCFKRGCKFGRIYTITACYGMFVKIDLLYRCLLVINGLFSICIFVKCSKFSI